MADMSVTGVNTGIDINKLKKLTAEEILKEEGKGTDIPSELVAWAEQMAAFAKIPDNVTYEQVDGDVGIDALDKLGITPEEAGLAEPQAENAVAPEETVEPGAVQDPARAQDAAIPPEQDQNIFMNATPGQAAIEPPPTTQQTEEEAAQNETTTLADPALTTDPEEIRKRKRKLGLE